MDFKEKRGSCVFNAKQNSMYFYLFILQCDAEVAEAFRKEFVTINIIYHLGAFYTEIFC